MTGRMKITPAIRSLRAPATVLVLGALLLRALIPAGYMPGNLIAGEFAVLCPTGLPAEVAHQLHQGHLDDGEQQLDMDSECPIGAALQLIAISSPATIDATTIHQPWYEMPGSENAPAADRRRNYLIRGPPSV